MLDFDSKIRKLFNSASKSEEGKMKGELKREILDLSELECSLILIKLRTMRVAKQIERSDRLVNVALTISILSFLSALIQALHRFGVF